MAFIHGKGTIVLCNQFNLSAYFNEVSVARSVETAETTTFSKSAKCVMNCHTCVKGSTGPSAGPYVFKKNGY